MIQTGVSTVRIAPTLPLRQCGGPRCRSQRSDLFQVTLGHGHGAVLPSPLLLAGRPPSLVLVVAPHGRVHHAADVHHHEVNAAAHDEDEYSTDSKDHDRKTKAGTNRINLFWPKLTMLQIEMVDP